MRTTLMILGAMMLVTLVAAGSFWGGMAYQTRQANQARAEFMSARGLGNAGQLPLDSQLAPGMQNPNFLGGRGTMGQVKAINGKTITLSTAQDVTTVLLTEATQIEKTVAGTAADVQPGMRGTGAGGSGSQGDLTATPTQTRDDNPTSHPGPPPAVTEP